MTFRPGLQRGLIVLLSAALFATVAPFAGASTSSLAVCDTRLDPIKPITLRTLREANTAHLATVYKQHPAPGFDNIEVEVKNEQVCEIGPRALQQILGSNYSFLSTPAPKAAMDAAAGLMEEGRSIVVHKDIEWHGRRTSTAVFASLPKTLKPNPTGKLVGAEYPVVYVHLHGGGTPTATGMNAMSIGQALAAKGIPMIAMDLPGHGRATRKIDGLTTFQDQIDWVMALVDMLVNQKVKIIFSGHSWGSEFTAFMQRQSTNPRYTRVGRFMTVSPPIDVSEGGDEQITDEFERQFEKGYEQLEKLAAKGDFDFMKNTIRNGKTSTVGGLFTAFTSMDYKMPVLPPAEYAKLMPSDDIEGGGDIITYLGREKAAKAIFPNIQILPPMPNWKSKTPQEVFITGHTNVWDAYIPESVKVVNGVLKGDSFMYELFTRRAFEVAGTQNMGADNADFAEKLVDEMARDWSNFFLFRQYVKSRDEYVNVASNVQKEWQAKKDALDGYIAFVSARNQKLPADIKARQLEALAKLRADLGIADDIAPERAKVEIELHKQPDLTPDRRAVLQAYMDKVRDAEASVTAETFKDPEWDKDVENLKKKYGQALAAAGVADIHQYRPVLEELAKKCDERKAYMQQVQAKLRDMETRGEDTSQVRGELALLPTKEDREQDKKRSGLASLDQEYKKSARAHQGRFGKARDAAVDAIHKPEGVADFGKALRLLELDRTNDRAGKLQSYVDKAPGAIAQAEKDERQRVANEEAADNRPEGVADLASAQALRGDIDAMENFVYCPKDDAEICALVAKIKDLTAKQITVQNERTGKRTKALKDWTEVWGKENSTLTSPALVQFSEDLEKEYQRYESVQRAFEHPYQDWIRQLKAEGRLTEAVIVAGTPDLLKLRTAAQAAKIRFEQMNAKVETLRASEAIAGHLTGDAEDVQKATDTAKSLWGNSVTNPSPDSLVAQARVSEDETEQQRRKASELAQELDRTKWEYSLKMVEHGHTPPNLIQRISIRDMLDLSYPDLIARLREDGSPVQRAFRNTLSQWNSYLSTLRVEAGLRDNSNY